MAKRRFILWLFPLALLLAQSGAFVHGIAHAAGDTANKSRVATSELCNECVGFAKLTHVAADVPVRHDTERPDALQRQEPLYRFVAVHSPPYRSRGPPTRL